MPVFGLSLRRFAFIIGAMGLLLALAARLRKSAAQTALSVSPSEPNNVSHAPVSSPLHRMERGSGGEVASIHRPRLAFAGIVTLSLSIPWLLPRPLASLLFAGLMVASVAVAAWSAPERTRAIIQAIFRRIQRSARIIAFPFAYFYTLVMTFRGMLSLVFAWSAVVFMVVSAYLLLPEQGVGTVKDGAQYALMGGIALGASMLLAPRLALPMPGGFQTHPYAAHVRRIPTVAGALGLALLAEISGNLLHTDLLDVVSHHTQFALLCLSLVLLTWGLSGSALRFSTGWLERVNWGELAALLAITALAFGLRWWQLGEAVHFFVDEVNFVSAVLEFRTTNHVPLLAPFSSITAFPWLYPYLQSEAVDGFGRNLVGLRAVSVVMGALTIPALYLLAKALFDRKTALLAALLLAVFPPHVHFSRLGINNIADPLFGTLALAFLARGRVHQRRADYVIGGVALGLTQYFYEGGRLLYPALVVLWLGGGLLLWRRTQRAVTQQTRHIVSLQARGLALAGLAALLAAFPIYYSLLGVNLPLASRMRDVGLNADYWSRLLSTGDPQAWQMHLERIGSAFAVYIHQPEGSLFYGGSQPLLLGYLVPVFLLGAFYALWRLRSPGALLLALWVVMTSLGSSLLVESSTSTRFVVAFPALALLAAVGVRCLLPLLGLNRLHRSVQYTLVGGLMAAFVVGQITYYFGPHLEQFRNDYYYTRPSHDGQDVAFRAAGFPPGTQAHVVTKDVYLTLPDDAAILNFLSDGVHIDHYRSRDINPEMLSRLPLYVDHAFFIEPQDLSTFLLLRQHFVLEGPQFSPWNVPMSRQFILYYAHHWQQPRR
jgi:4-amino-4-deoxy-L-arabinose transferase-like glycosyltransferase